MKLKIVPLYEQIRKELDIVCLGIVWQEFTSTEVGGKITRGRHVDIFVPQKLTAKETASILNIFEQYYADIESFKRKKGYHNISENGKRYRLLTFDY